ncbi:SDR family oxidoreductase [Azospirillum sp. RWY-5-1]|uniref:dTDP-4-dehydrorhamnose reductase n=1 Tax=Azospirillum oleiclasticum TaxID=2735135 RepID=A0ABX2TM00_9PROT|nr:SDR family oxidoreductase [Azospirillum oleiclasticum]NYZ17771.1 SDR family oxidoreductase [Azospirillum oleiclasticum]NYZ24183.1 SDR family oxidoreductase [Azospirillum oleiclasticum]
MKVLILGGSGMLGHKLAQVLTASGVETVAALRKAATPWPGWLAGVRRVAGPEAADEAGLERLLQAERPDAVLNAIGVIKQVIGGDDPSETIHLNALFPHRLAALCRAQGSRLVHFSTDCVFAGTEDGRRGRLGYREEDPADARDLYGMSKLLGEPAGPGCLVIRTSIIGHELRGRHSLVEWFLAQGDRPVRGFRRALFSGLPTVALAELVSMLLRDFPGLDGVWHVGADAISKHDLLALVSDVYGLSTDLRPDDDFHCDRRLDSSRFRERTGWRPMSWEGLVRRMHDDSTLNRR